MERLTEKHYLGTDHYMKCSGDCNVDMDCIDCPAFDHLVERLAAYEDTGLMPEEITALEEELQSAKNTADQLDAINTRLLRSNQKVKIGMLVEDPRTYAGESRANYFCTVCGKLNGTWAKGLKANQLPHFCCWCGALFVDGGNKND